MIQWLRLCASTVVGMGSILGQGNSACLTVQQNKQTNKKPIHSPQILFLYGFPGDSAVKNPPADAEDSGLRKIPWRRKWQPTCILAWTTPKDRGAWQATVYRVTKELDVTEHTHIHCFYIVK